MPEKTLPPVPQIHPALGRRRKLIIGLAVLGGVLLVTLAILGATGAVRPFYIPTAGMAPAVSSGDHVLVERFTFAFRKPKRGDIVVFKTDGIHMIPSATIYIKRIAGEPGEHLRISEGKLYVDNKPVSVSNRWGLVRYSSAPEGLFCRSPNDTIAVPAGQYFVLGDNVTNSFDGRYWGFLPAENIKGRALYCHWPPARKGPLR